MQCGGPDSSPLVAASHPLNLAAPVSPASNWDTHFLLHWVSLPLPVGAGTSFGGSISGLLGPFLSQQTPYSAMSCIKVSSTLGPHGRWPDSPGGPQVAAHSGLPAALSVPDLSFHL